MSFELTTPLPLKLLYLCRLGPPYDPHFQDPKIANKTLIMSFSVIFKDTIVFPTPKLV